MASRKMFFEPRIIAFALISVMFAVPVNSINCYQCISTNNEHPFQCNEFLSSDIDMEPTSCDDVYGAQYCVKHVGRSKGLGINCYQCTSSDDWKCQDGELVTSALELKNCDHVFEAQYCVKTTGRYGEGVGTKRYCSSVYLGNFCKYVENVGDSLSYRTCIYTCGSDGCNPASTSKPNAFTLVVSSLFAISVISRLR